MFDVRGGAGLRYVASLLVLSAVCHRPAIAQTWRVDPAFGVESTFTNNVNLSPGSERKADWVNALTPSVRFTEVGAHSRITGTVSVPVLLYLRTPHENNYVAPIANVLGRFEVVDRLFYIDGLIDVSQRYASAFAAHPADLATATDNRYTSQLYRISPFLQQTLPNDMDYELRQSSLWTNGNASGGLNERAYTNEVSGHLAKRPVPFGWSLEFDRIDTDFKESDNSELLENSRVRGIYQATPTLLVSASAGYEDNHFVATRESGPIYGVGMRWHPSERTSIDADWEHRFFGSSYHVVAGHRSPLSIASIQAMRDLTTFPQQLAQFPAGVSVSGLLDTLFQSRFPDPFQRQSLVDQIIRDRGLPSTLTTPIAIFAERVTVLESLAANLGLLGARNSVLFTAYRQRSRPVAPADLAELSSLLLQQLDQTQVGANAVWSHQLGSRMTLSVGVDWSRTSSNGEVNAVSRQYALRTDLSTALSPLTTLHAGVRYQNFRTDVFSSFQELAAVVGVTHVFH
jgi:uncharacterized protein (PEP-CTERM system associated)